MDDKNFICKKKKAATKIKTGIQSISESNAENEASFQKDAADRAF